MTATRIDGRALSQILRSEVKARAARVHAVRGRPVGLAVVRVGDDPASKVYVGQKAKAAAECGLVWREVTLPATATTAQIVAATQALNVDDGIDGYLVQQPLPRQVDTSAVVDSVAPHKDVDGFHPINVGRLSLGDARALVPCTPAGVMRMIASTGVSVRGKNAVVVGRSAIVGRPMASLLLSADATVTVCHRHSDLKLEVSRADVLVVAAGSPGLIQGEWVKPGSVVIDVGMNRRSDGTLCGDVDFEAASQRAAFITPVPGGVGPMTVAQLMENCVQAALRR